MLSLIFGPRSTHYKELASLADQLGAASYLLSANSRASADTALGSDRALEALQAASLE